MICERILYSFRSFIKFKNVDKCIFLFLNPVSPIRNRSLFEPFRTIHLSISVGASVSNTKSFGWGSGPVSGLSLEIRSGNSLMCSNLKSSTPSFHRSFPLAKQFTRYP